MRGRVPTARTGTGLKHTLPESDDSAPLTAELSLLAGQDPFHACFFVATSSLLRESAQRERRSSSGKQTVTNQLKKVEHIVVLMLAGDMVGHSKARSRFSSGH
jgi:hypothetical protein